MFKYEHLTVEMIENVIKQMNEEAAKPKRKFTLFAFFPSETASTNFHIAFDDAIKKEIDGYKTK